LTAQNEIATLLYISGPLLKSDMLVKQKVTLYISDDLHRQVKIRSAIDGETMSSIAQRAIEFYLGHPDTVKSSGEVHGQAHRLYACPKCAVPVALREDGLALVQSHSSQKFEDMTGLERIAELSAEPCSPDERTLIPC
jgi:hypothetical protein